MGISTTVIRILISFLFCSTLSLGRYLSNDNLFREVKRLAKEKRTTEDNKLFFKTGEDLPSETIGTAHEDIVLECQAGGKPAASIHWLKNGIRIQQGPSRDYKNDELFVEEILNEKRGALIGLGFTKSKLYLDCLSPEDEGEYSCVAETATQRIVQTTQVSVVGRFESKAHEKCIVKKSIHSASARIFLWTSHRVEISGASVQLMCRVEGSPSPMVSWVTPKGKEISHPTEKYEVLSNGDLLIRNISWKDMGSYTCSCANDAGVDEISTFLYPTRRRS
ncbi:zwei Ig domain protein zig-4-like [Mytilus californianus]|uniref:zwei Ig domain protein zig-4-like n=1 Tax=Mytilus californianus TaxID=6549 RepID=UPI0022453CE0|nr:zwei Ig domain protein zig-4-like [Mytilus californianus]